MTDIGKQRQTEVYRDAYTLNILQKWKDRLNKKRHYYMAEPRSHKRPTKTFTHDTYTY